MDFITIYVSEAVLPCELSTDQVLSSILSYPVWHVLLYEEEEEGTIFPSTLYMRKLRLPEVRAPPPQHQAAKRWSSCSDPGALRPDPAR